MNPPIKICLISSVPGFFWSFYRQLPLRLKEEGFEVEICSSPGCELELLKRQNDITVHGIELLRKISPFQDFKSLFSLILLFRKKHYDIIHLHSPKASLLGMIAGVLTGTKCRIYTCHGLPLETETGLKRILLTLTEKLTCRLAQKIIIVSKSLKEKLLFYKLCKKEKMLNFKDGTACGIDLKRFRMTDEIRSESDRIRSQLNINDDTLVVGFIGRLVPDKGIDFLVEAFSELYATNNKLRLLVIGDLEPHRGRLSQDFLDKLQSHPGIIRVGYTLEIEYYYAMIDIFVLPTLREGFPYTIIEASAMGIPVIATRVTGCVDAILDGNTGILVEAKNIFELKKAILEMIENPQKRRLFGQNAQKRVEKCFDSDVLMEEHIHFYKGLLECD